jgi:hypothetical protein
MKDDDSDSEEDEVSKQKRLIKELKAKPGKSKGARATNTTTSRAFSSASVSAGRRGGSRQARAAVASYKESSDASDDDFETESEAAPKPVSASKRKVVVDDSSSESYEGDSQSGADEDDEDDDEGSVEVLVPSKRSFKKTSGSTVLVDASVERDILAAQRGAPKAQASTLHKISWLRVVLDEAHQIKVSSLLFKSYPSYSVYRTAARQLPAQSSTSMPCISGVSLVRLYKTESVSCTRSFGSFASTRTRTTSVRPRAVAASLCTTGSPKVVARTVTTQR